MTSRNPVQTASPAVQAAKLRGILESAVTAIITIGERGVIEDINPATERLFGYSASELLGENVKILMPEPYRSEHDGYISNYVATGLKKIIGIGREVSGRRKDGSIFPVHLSVSEFAADGRRYFTGMIHDISDRMHVEEALRESERRLAHSQKMEAVGRLAGGLAHDFNNLLTVIMGHSQVLLNDMGVGHPLKNKIEEMQKAGERAAALIRQLLTFSRRQPSEPKVLDLNLVLINLETMLRRLIGEDIDLTLSASRENLRVKADPAQLEQIVMNLVVNARDAMPKGGKLVIESASANLGRTPVYHLSPLPPGAYVRLSVSDTGCGMPPEVQAHIFEPFFTTKEMGKGTGLGLSTVYGIVTQSGGHIWVDSEPGKGSILTVVLPAVEAPVASGDRGLEHGERALRGTETVLLVEDNDAVRDLARQALTRYGYRVLVASNGEQALRVASAHLHSLSLVVTDVVMPVMGGRELAARLAKLRRGLKVLFTSGYTNGTVKQEVPGTLFLEKPFTPAALGKKVREVLDAVPAQR